jgi:ABC-type multidrug transport system fused ATPase/permease subunit
MLIGSIGAIATGISYPIMFIFFGNIIESGIEFNTKLSNCNYSLSSAFEFEKNSTGILDSRIENIKIQAVYLSSNKIYIFINLVLFVNLCLFFLVLGVVTTFSSYFQVSFWLMSAERQTKSIRLTLFRSILKQEIEFFDVYKSGELTNRLTDDIMKIKDGIGDKLGSFIQYISAFISGIVIGYFYEKLRFF